MNESAIEDLLTQSLNGWYSEVSQWMPGSSDSIRACEACHWELKVVIDPEAWPHELVDSLAAGVKRVVMQVTESEIEERGTEPESTESAVQSIVLGVLARHGGDIVDVLEQCIRYRVEAFELLELELAELGGF